MVTELAYALITPYSLLKSRTGGIIGRMLALPNLKLVGAHMYAPSDTFVDEYIANLASQEMPGPHKKALVKYCDEKLRPNNELGITNRALLLLFEGKDAVRSLKKDVIGSFGTHIGPSGDTVRGTYGDFVEREDGTMVYFEPAVLTCTNHTILLKQLAVFDKYADSDGGVLENIVPYPKGVTPQTTLVIIKPDNFVRSSSRPGNIIDRFSRTGLFIVGAKVLRLSVAQANKFYGPLRTLFVDKLKGNVSKHLKPALNHAFDFEISDETYGRIAELLKDANAQCEFLKIVSYMTGVPVNECNAMPETGPGRATSLALLYQGQDAIEKIRTVLGSTNPEEAAEGTVRSDFGLNLMQNGAHASDSPENALREREIVGLSGKEKEWDVQVIIRDYLSKVKG